MDSIRLGDLQAPPDQFGVILGDFLNNLRAVLDHLVGALVKRFGNPVSWGHAFPILTAEKDWPNDPNWPKLAGIPLGWQAVIKCLQPYHRRDDPKQHPLAVLSILNNADKHRTLHPLVTTPSEFDVEGTKPDGASIEYRFLPPFTRLEEGTELYAVRADPPSDFDVRVNPDVTVQIAFEHEGLSGVFGDLSELFEAVQHVLVCLLPAFD